MSALKLFIWQGDGISDAYHDDGTLVVLAHTPEEARTVVRQQRADCEKQKELWDQEYGDFIKSYGMERNTVYGEATPANRKQQELDEKYPLAHNFDLWDGTDEALNRDPDEVLEIDAPKVVAFNGGGYD